MTTPSNQSGEPDTSGETKSAAKSPTHPHHHHPETVAEGAVVLVEEVGEVSVRIAEGTVVTTLAYFGEVVTLLIQTFQAMRRGINLNDLMRQMAVIGVDSIPIALLTVGFSGAVLALYLVATFSNYGANSLVGGVVALSIVRETAPILTGVSLAARSGSAITAEIGSMKVSEQIDALRSMAISPVEYLVVPRLIACLIMLPIVCVFADAAGVLGGALVALRQGIPIQEYTNSIQLLLKPDGSDISKGLLKTIFFGAIIALIGCREGLNTGGGATGVGQSTTRSVVVAIVLIFFADYVLSFLLFKGTFF